MLTLDHIKEAIRMGKNSFHRIKKYKGNAEQICKQITKECWNGKYFKTSLNNYPQFYNRDFGICCKALIKQGYKKQVLKTLVYALEIFRLYESVTTNITTDHVPIDCFYHTPESLSFILNDLVLLNNKKLINEYKDFLEKQAKKIYDNDFDKNLNILKKDKRFSSMKDNSIRISSCYNNCMLAMLSNNLTKLKLQNPFRNHNIKKAIKKHFWHNGFIDDLSGRKIYSGDANTFPYWCNIFTDKSMWKQSLKRIQELELDKPFPLKYTNKRIKEQELKPMSYFIPNWEGDTVWCHLGLCFIDVVKRFDKKLAKHYIQQYKQIIEKHKNFLEVFNKDKTMYKTIFYKCDSGMLWACKYLELA